MLHFYSVYHSLRYVNDQLVIRLNTPLPKGMPERLTKEFGDMLSSGAIEQRGALPGEADEPELAALPRLVLHFNRQQFGRLLQLIHRINAVSK